jgi:hypothetical protein
MRKSILVMIILLLSVFSVFAVNFEIGLQGFYDFEDFNNRVGVKIYHLAPNFDFVTDIGFYSDEKYSFHESDYYLDHYFLIENGYVTFRGFNNDIKFSSGIKDLQDEVNSPYSLFFSSERISQPYLEFGYEDEHMFYDTRWIQLVSSSNKYFDEPKSMNYKTYGLKFGDFRFGYQDAVVYNREFDFFYLFNPLPVYFSQEIRSSSNTMPWAEESINDNSLMGFFIDYDKPTYYFYSQILVDDLNTNRFFYPEKTQNPDKIAFSSGITFKTGAGNFGLHGALSTQYTFAPGGGPSYTVYPDNKYENKIINYKENYIGYKYGENAASVLVDYLYTYKNRFDIYSSFETIFSGSKSPTQKIAPLKGTHFLDEDTLEKSFIYTISANLYFKFFELNASAHVGKIFNELIYDDTNDCFVPSNIDKDLLNVDLGFKVKF